MNAEANQKNPMSHLDSLSRIAPILGESAIIDKETGRVFWQGGRKSLFDSTVGHSYLSNQEEGVLRHVRATLFSCILWMSFIRFIAEWGLKQSILTRLTETLIRPSQRFIDVVQILTRAMLFCLACLPRFSREFVVVIVVMYLLESHACNTRKYLDNALSCPDEVESFMEGLREEKPCVGWQIRCYHYEKNWLCLILLIDFWKYIFGLFQQQRKDKQDGSDLLPVDDHALGPSMFTRKVVSHQKKEFYQFGSYQDETIGGIWKQAQATTSVMAAFTKISVYKLLLFTDKRARVDYFKQQSNFISREGAKDEYAEFSTRVDGELLISNRQCRCRIIPSEYNCLTMHYIQTVQGYKERVLAVRPTRGAQKLFQTHYFWLFTFLGLTVPYRIRFGKHCDCLRVAVVKETSAKNKTEIDPAVPSKQSWFTSPLSWFGGLDLKEDVQGKRERFKKRMQEISLYQGNRDEAVLVVVKDASEAVLVVEDARKIEDTINSTKIEILDDGNEVILEFEDTINSTRIEKLVDSNEAELEDSALGNSTETENEVLCRDKDKTADEDI